LTLGRQVDNFFGVFEKKTKTAQPEFFIVANQIPKIPKATFYAKLEQTLESFEFSRKVREICAPAYKQSALGRPGIDPVVYLKMMMIGFFENLPSERSIAQRCADSISIREFLGYELDEKTPEHSSFTVIRQRLGAQVFQEIFQLTLEALETHGLLRGKNLGIDSSVIEANASLRALVDRNTGEEYWNYVKKLAQEQGIDPKDEAAVRKFDRNRPGKGSNEQWKNPHDPDAKIGRKKDGATDMIYKPEVVVDLDTGAVVQAEVHSGDQSDHKEVSTRVLEAQQAMNPALGQAQEDLSIQTLTADKGYYKVQELQGLQEEGIKTVIADCIDNRRVDKLEPGQAQAVKSARRSVQSKYGKELLGRRGMHIERSFAHILDCGGMRRTTLRGWVNLNKRFKLAAAIYNLSQIMRKLFGFGTPRQLEAGMRAFFGLLLSYFVGQLLALVDSKAPFIKNTLLRALC
jgi:transposase